MFINSVRQPVKILVKKSASEEASRSGYRMRSNAIRTADTRVSLLLPAIKSICVKRKIKSFSAACCLS